MLVNVPSFLAGSDTDMVGVIGENGGGEGEGGRVCSGGTSSLEVEKQGCAASVMAGDR